MERCNVKDIMEFRFKFRYEINGMKNYTTYTLKKIIQYFYF